jgi:hypothetical protein
MKKPFWGSWEERMAARDRFNNRIEELCSTNPDKGVNLFVGLNIF